MRFYEWYENRSIIGHNTYAIEYKFIILKSNTLQKFTFTAQTCKTNKNFQQTH